MWLREADFRVGIYTYNDDNLTWLVIGFLAFQFRLPTLKGRYGFLVTREASWCWWGRRSMRGRSPVELTIVSKQYLDDCGVLHDNYVECRSMLALEGTRRCGRFELFCMEIVSIRKVVTYRRWCKWWRKTSWMVVLEKTPKREGFYEQLVYELSSAANLETIRYILHKDRRVLRAMEQHDDLCTFGYIREHRGLRPTHRCM